MNKTGPDLYAEWQRPWVPALYLAAVCGTFAAITMGIDVAAGDTFYPFGAIIIPAFAAFGVFLALISARRIRLEPDALWQGSKRIPLGRVTETRIVHGRELWRVRFQLSIPSAKASALPIGSSVADIGVPGAGYMWATRDIRRGNCCSPGTGPAVMLLTPSLLTPVWIVGSRHAEELRAAIDRARAVLPPEYVPDEHHWPG